MPPATRAVDRRTGDEEAAFVVDQQDRDGVDLEDVANAYEELVQERTEVEVSIQVGALRKALLVRGDRAWSPSLLGPRPGTPSPFVKMPITYERAFGGCALGPDAANQREFRNPAGTGFAWCYAENRYV